ncbi:hypothetical protein ETB97_008461 [Aspergillus alliaceus]|uniref:Uncharacterized protein n=1 Tax=Petromyces alliaceus TaxID=209559 RepID=A0A8H5ZSY7_PETAA|nr:hypothetical protein ETB97_008461 [Aspergillus burnettii]
MVPSDPAMSHTPADEPDSLRRYDVICQSVSLTVTSLVVLMRVLVKFLVIHSPTKDDYACIVAWLGLIAYGVISLEADKHGSGVHQEYVAHDDLRRYTQQ